MLSVPPDHIVSADWHVLLCKPNKNHIALRCLGKQGFELFMPRMMAQRRWRGRVFIEPRPLFAGYIFVSIDAARPRWREIMMAPGIARIIGHGLSGPARVPPEIIAGLMARCDDEGLLRSDPDIVEGDHIRIVSGPFAGFVTQVERIDEERRLQVLLEILGGKVRARLDSGIAVRFAEP